MKTVICKNQNELTTRFKSLYKKDILGEGSTLFGSGNIVIYRYMNNKWYKVVKE